MRTAGATILLEATALRSDVRRGYNGGVTALRGTGIACVLGMVASGGCSGNDPPQFDDPVAIDCSGAGGGFPTVVFEARSLEKCEPPVALKGTLPEGAACTDAIECEPRCCSCPAGPKVYYAAACSEGKCQGAAITCCSPDRPPDACE